jgi:hypothetical protein
LFHWLSPPIPIHHADPEAVKKYGLSNSYQLAPRAQIFRRDNGNVQDEESLQYLMRYNDYLNDPIACVCVLVSHDCLTSVQAGRPMVRHLCLPCVPTSHCRY